MFCVCAMCPAINKYKTPGHACSCTLTTRLSLEPHHIMAFGDLGTKSARLVEWLSGGCRLSGRKCERRKVAALNIFLSLSLSVLFGACAAYTRVSAGDTCDAHATLYKATANTYESINWSVHLHINTHAQSV
jgi:hypothetical protein